jgi:LPS-assembly protein
MAAASMSRKSIVTVIALLCHLLGAPALLTNWLHAQESTQYSVLSTQFPVVNLELPDSALELSSRGAYFATRDLLVPAFSGTSPMEGSWGLGAGNPLLPAAGAQRLTEGEPVTLRARQQEKHGDVYSLRGDVEIVFRNYTLQADEVVYHDATSVAEAAGHVVLDGGPWDEHITASHGTYNVRSETGRFWDVVGTTGAKFHGRHVLLTSSTPFSFHGQTVEIAGRDKIVVNHGTVTSCALPHPQWWFQAGHISVVAGANARMYDATFWLWHFPVFFFPFFDHPVEHLGRKTGILLPSFSRSSTRGYTMGEGIFWAINGSMDAEAGAEYFSKRGWSQTGEFRARFEDNSYLFAHYFGVLDRGLPNPPEVAGPGGAIIQLPSQEGGEEVILNGEKRFSPNFRAVLDADYLSSFVFRVAFSDSYSQATNSEVRSVGFLTDNENGYSLSALAARYQNFLSTIPDDVVTIAHAPSLEASTVDRRLAGSPFYWGLDAAADSLLRITPTTETSQSVASTESVNAGRFDLEPHLSLPWFWRGWTLRPEVYLRDTYYTSRSAGGAPVGAGEGINRRALDTEAELRPPALARVFAHTWRNRTWKHTIEPRITYRDVTGVDNFRSILRFDERDILNDTNEIEYAVVQRLYAKPLLPSACPPAAEQKGAGRAEGPGAGGHELPWVANRPPAAPPCFQGVREIVTWELAQKYFFDPFFGGALQTGVSNVLASTVDFTGIAFLTRPRNLSPVISRLRVRAARLDAEWRLDYDTQNGIVTSSYTYLNYRLPSGFGVGGGDAYLQIPGEATAVSPQTSTAVFSTFNQFRVLLSYGNPAKKGITAATTIGYDAEAGSVQYAAVQSSYNWDCCGLTFEYRRFALGSVRNENQFRFALTLANVGTFGNLRKQERLF